MRERRNPAMEEYGECFYTKHREKLWYVYSELWKVVGLWMILTAPHFIYLNFKTFVITCITYKKFKNYPKTNAPNKQNRSQV